MLNHLKHFFRNSLFLGIGATFAINSLIFSFWITRLPGVKESLGLSEGVLGLALFCMPIGALVSMVLSSKIIHAFGAGKVTIWSGMFFSLAMILPVSAMNIWFLGFALFIAGLFTGLMDVAMNAVAAEAEKQGKKVIMSTCHGFWSLGGMLGAFLGSLFVGLKFNGVLQAVITAIIASVILFTWIKSKIGDLDGENSEDGHGFTIPRGPIIGLAIIGFCIMIGEGAIADWSAVFLKEWAGASAYVAGFGYAGFSLSMTIGRFFGDEIINRFGGLPVVRIGSAIALIGGGLVLITQPWLAILGFSLMGLGYSCVVPVVFSSSANIEGMTPSQGISAVATLGYTGFLVGPVIIGWLAEYFGLQMGFVLLMVLSVLAIVYAPRAFSFQILRKG